MLLVRFCWCVFVMQLVGDHFLIKTDIKNMNKAYRECYYNTLTNALTALSKHSKDA